MKQLEKSCGMDDYRQIQVSKYYHGLSSMRAGRGPSVAVHSTVACVTLYSSCLVRAPILRKGSYCQTFLV